MSFRYQKMLRLLGTWIALGVLAACTTGSPAQTQLAPDLPTPGVAVTSAPTRTAASPATQIPTESPSRLGVAEEDLNGVSIDFWHIWGWESGQALQDLVDEFNITNPYGIRAEAANQETYSDLTSHLDEALRLGEGPNLVVGFNNQLQSWDARWSIVQDLTEYVTDPQWGYTASERDDFFEIFWGQDEINGERFGLPAQRSAQLLFYNRSWANELGFEEPPKTPEEFRDQACASAEAYRDDDNPSNDGTGGWVVDTSTATVLSWAYAFGASVEAPEGYSFDTEPFGQALAFLKGLFDQGCAWLSQNRYPNPEFASRRALMISSSTAGIPFQEDAFLDTGSPDEWQAIAFPDQEGEGVVDVFGPSFAMLKSTPEEELATWILIRWLLEPENQARWVRASGHLPSRQTAVDALEDYADDHPQWAEAMELLPLGRPEPDHTSWGTVRFALSDAAEQVFRLGLTSDQVPALLEELDQTAAELHARER